MRKVIGILMVAVLAVPLIGCQARQTEEGEMPEVEVKGGELPEYDVSTADVDVKTKETTIEVPTIDVDVQSPSENEAEEAAEGDDPN
jgi:hypothetical protein